MPLIPSSPLRRLCSRRISARSSRGRPPGATRGGLSSFRDYGFRLEAGGCWMDRRSAGPFPPSTGRRHPWTEQLRRRQVRSFGRTPEQVRTSEVSRRAAADFRISNSITNPIKQNNCECSGDFLPTIRVSPHLSPASARWKRAPRLLPVLTALRPWSPKPGGRGSTPRREAAFVLAAAGERLLSAVARVQLPTRAPDTT